MEVYLTDNSPKHTIEVNMEWKNKSGISLIGLIFFFIFLIIAELGYQSQIALILAEAAISIPITFILIEWVIKREREEQWEKVKW